MSKWKLRDRVWIPMHLGRAPVGTVALVGQQGLGSLEVERRPGIVVGENLVLIQHPSPPGYLERVTGPLGSSPTWTVEPIRGRPLELRDQRRFAFDHWAPVQTFIKFQGATGKKAPACWYVSLRQEMDLPWVIARGRPGDLGMCLESVRALLTSENHPSSLPPCMVEGETPNVCPPEDLDALPGFHVEQARQAVEALISGATTRGRTD